MWMAGQGLTQLSPSTLTHTDLALLAPQVKLCSLRDGSNCASPEGIYSLEGRSQSLGLAHGGAGLGERVTDSAARQAQDAYACHYHRVTVMENDLQALSKLL